MTPMVRKNFEDDVNLRKIWEDSNFLGRIAQPHEFRGAALFLLSDASSFMTGSQVSPDVSSCQSSTNVFLQLIIDGGYTAW